MNKLIVVILGFLMGSILPIGSNNQELMGLAILLVLGNIIIEIFVKKKRALSILISSVTIGILASSMFQNWNIVAQIIALVIFSIASIGITILIELDENQGRSGSGNNIISDFFRKDDDGDEMKK